MTVARMAVCAAVLMVLSAPATRVAHAAPALATNNVNLRQGPGTNFRLSPPFRPVARSRSAAVPVNGAMWCGRARPVIRSPPVSTRAAPMARRGRRRPALKGLHHRATPPADRSRQARPAHRLLAIRRLRAIHHPKATRRHRPAITRGLIIRATPRTRIMVRAITARMATDRTGGAGIGEVWSKRLFSRSTGSGSL
jgi:hypothetical protein